jgi:hypothetical protein
MQMKSFPWDRNLPFSVAIADRLGGGTFITPSVMLDTDFVTVYDSVEDTADSYDTVEDAIGQFNYRPLSTVVFIPRANPNLLNQFEVMVIYHEQRHG